MPPRFSLDWYKDNVFQDVILEEIIFIRITDEKYWFFLTILTQGLIFFIIKKIREKCLSFIIFEKREILRRTTGQQGYMFELFQSIFTLYRTIFSVYLGLSCSIFVYLYFVLSRSISVHLGASRCILVYLDLSSSISLYLGLSWSILDSLGLSRTISDYLGLSPTISDYPG